MFSVIIYGRNDQHGYNLHKRAAISFNALAEVMTDPDDEILFVDYNTPDDYPTFPEAIQDTLTETARARLRIASDAETRPMPDKIAMSGTTWLRLRSKNVRCKEKNRT